MRTPFLTSAALLLALALAAPAAADVLAMPPLSGADKEADAADDILLSPDEYKSGIETGSTAESASEDAFMTLDALSADKSVEQEGETSTETPPTQTEPAVSLPTEGDSNSEGKFQQLLAPPAEPIDTPRRGLSMEQVEQLYGRPSSVTPPVGDPPITRWDYPKYSVYFEHSYVIDSVNKR